MNGNIWYEPISDRYPGLPEVMKKKTKGMLSRVLQGIGDLHAPFLVDTVIRRDVVLADSPEHELLLESRIDPDLLARSTDYILSICGTKLSSGHQLEYRSHQHSMYKKAIRVVGALTYAATTAALLDNPWLQCTKTVPPSAMAWWMNLHAAGKWMRRSA